MAVVLAAEQTAREKTLQVLRRTGNPFRNYFARNPDDEVCAKYHVSELFGLEREQLLGVVDLYRHDPLTHSEIVPVLGNKGSGKTHLLHSIKHGSEEAWQMLVTPGTYQKDADFMEYLLFQVIDTLLGGGRLKQIRPLEYVGEEAVRRLLHRALTAQSAEQKLDLFPVPGFGKWTRRLGLGSSQAQDRAQWLIDALVNAPPGKPGSIRRACAEVNLEPERACEVLCQFVERTEARDTAGLMRRHIHQGLARAVLAGDEADLANFLTYGFAELDYHVRPSRQDLVLALFKVLMGNFRELKIPVVVAFDQLEDLLLSRRSDDGRRTAEAFFAGIVQTMHQLDGICFLIFAERGLWNRFVPTLDGYIQDRLNNPVHLPAHGTIKTLRLEAPPPDLVRRVVEARLRPALEELRDCGDWPAIHPFTEDQILQIARTEPTLRDMLQQFRQLFDRLVYGTNAGTACDQDSAATRITTLPAGALPAQVKSCIIVETAPTEPNSRTPAGCGPATSSSDSAGSIPTLGELWTKELAAALAKLEPEGAVTGATRELQAGLGAILQIGLEHGVKVGPWRLQHAVPEWSYGDHPTYGVISIGHWVCKDGQPWKVGVGLFLARGPAKPKDLATKLAAYDAEPAVVDHLILLRPADDVAITGKSKTLWQEAERRGRHTRLEALELESLAILYAFPRWLAAVAEAASEGQQLPNLSDFIQEKCEKLLQQICMPVQGA